jgi:hypothetical protein
MLKLISLTEDPNITHKGNYSALSDFINHRIKNITWQQTTAFLRSPVAQYHSRPLLVL